MNPPFPQVTGVAGPTGLPIVVESRFIA